MKTAYTQGRTPHYSLFRNLFASFFVKQFHNPSGGQSLDQENNIESFNFKEAFNSMNDLEGYLKDTSKRF